MPANGLTNHALLGNKAVVSIGSISGAASGSETFNPVGDFIQASLDGGTRTIIDVSTLISTFKEKRGGLPDAGKVTITANFLPTSSDVGQTALFTAWGSGNAYDFEIQLDKNVVAVTPQTTKGDTLTFSAIVSTGPKMDISNDKAVQIEMTLEINGPITYTAGS